MVISELRVNGTRRVALSFPESEKESRSRTKQSFKKEADINNIMSRFAKTGLIPQVVGSPFYGDFSGEVDFVATVDRVNKARTAFDMLPSDLRKRFDNDVAKLLEFVSKPENYEEAVKLKLRLKDPVKEAAIAAEKAVTPQDKAQAGGAS